MGKAGRLACITIPMVLTLASLICLLLVFLGGLNKKDPNLRALYYFKADTSHFKSNLTSGNPVTIAGQELKPEILSALTDSANSKSLADVYFIYMWNYCSGTKDATTGVVDITYCSPRKARYYFNPIEEWGLNNTVTQNALGKGVNNALKAYKGAASWMFVAYAIAFWVTAASVIVGIFAICSRIGSCVTTVVISAATLFTILSAITSTVLFSTLVGALTATLKPYNVSVSLGTRMLSLDWLAVAFSVGASMFWFVSICCCSGKSSHNKRDTRSSMGSNAPYKGFGARGYQPLGEEGGHMAGARQSRGMEMQDLGHTSAGPFRGRETAYEPFRHERV